MFTGLIEAVGSLESSNPAGAGRRIRVTTAIAGELRSGDSVAVNGVCLTVVSRDEAAFEADLAPETLRVTTLGALGPGSRVNLERAIRAGDRLGGHFVQGHVDGVAHVVSNVATGDTRRLVVDLPHGLAPSVIGRGSIAIDGVSLTVASLDGRRVGIQIVPFTAAETTLSALAPGQAVNVETDMLGKYVRRLLEEHPGLTAVARPGSHES